MRYCFQIIYPHSNQRKNAPTDSDIATLQKIKELAGRIPTDQIPARLLLVDTQPTPPSSSLALLPEIASRFQQLESDRQQTNSALSDLRARLERLENASIDTARLERLESWAALPWWKRLFIPPPS